MGEENLLVGFYSDIAQQPGALLRRISEFLGTSYNPGLFPLSDRVFNKTRRMRIPSDLHDALADFYHEDIEESVKQFPGKTSGWLDRA